MSQNLAQAIHTARQCLSCQKPLPALRVRSGRYGTRGAAMTTIDPEVIFCTLRCAARYGVLVATRLLQEKVR